MVTPDITSLAEPLGDLLLILKPGDKQARHVTSRFVTVLGLSTWAPA